ncbi:Type-1 fimbrial protein, A chain precursor [compost metagenome]
MIKFAHATLSLGLLFGLVWPASQALAEVSSFCKFQGGSGELTFVSRLPTTYLPLDAKIGTEFGPESKLIVPTSDGRRVQCYNDGTVTMRFRMRPVRPPLAMARSGQILPTNVEGIGARIQLLGPFDGIADGTFRPEDGHTWIPFTAIREDRHTFFNFVLSHLSHKITLVKTGSVTPGKHLIDSDMFRGDLDFSTGVGFKFRLQAEVIQAQCTIGADPVTPNPVPLGDYSRSEFTHVGYTTPKVDFRITLAACQIDPDPDNATFATLELISQEAEIVPGVFGLTTDSDAAGVGIQVFKGDDSPMPLNVEEPMVPLNDGTTVLHLKAGFYQTESSHAVRAGLAKGRLNFIVRYR